MSAGVRALHAAPLLSRPPAEWHTVDIYMSYTLRTSLFVSQTQLDQLTNSLACWMTSAQELFFHACAGLRAIPGGLSPCL